jgi:serine protease Do
MTKPILLITISTALLAIAPPPENSVASEGETTKVAKSWQRIVLRTGNEIEGEVVKRTPKSLFVDIGYTILSIPLSEVDTVVEPESEAKSPASGDPSTAAESATRNGDARNGGTKDSIFFTKTLEPGTVKDKAYQVGESVVHVLTLSGSGSGFIIDDKDGYIVTNYHVVERERDISVVIYVREKAGLRKVKIEKVRIVALNPFFDLALLKLADPSEIPLRKCFLGDYARVLVGDPVFAIGNPLGLDRTVSDGIVSNRNRALGGKLAIQTTAAINPGNSGGPLFNNRGEVIGVTSSKMIGGESLGFAIPVHYVKDFLRHREAFAFDKDNPNTGVRYLRPPPKPHDKNKKVSSKSAPKPDDKVDSAPVETKEF